MAKSDREDSKDSSSNAAPSQAELSRKALEMKRKAEAGHETESMAEDGSPLHPRDVDADKGKKGLAETHHHGAPSGAFDHAGQYPARERSGPRGGS